jgi:hypothetical protein
VTMYARMNRTTAGSPSGNITHTSSGATTKNVAVSGTASNPPASTLKRLIVNVKRRP